MPLEQCTSKGKKGWRWGKSGTCYTGPNARNKAIEQMKAIKASQARQK